MTGTRVIPGFLPDHFVVNHKPLGNKCTISWSVRVVTVTGEIKLSYCFQFQKNSNKYKNNNNNEKNPQTPVCDSHPPPLRHLQPSNVSPNPAT